jgi:hypothetical protein
MADAGVADGVCTAMGFKGQSQHSGAHWVSDSDTRSLMSLSNSTKGRRGRVRMCCRPFRLAFGPRPRRRPFHHSCRPRRRGQFRPGCADRHSRSADMHDGAPISDRHGELRAAHASADSDEVACVRTAGRSRYQPSPWTFRGSQYWNPFGPHDSTAAKPQAGSAARAAMPAGAAY